MHRQRLERFGPAALPIVLLVAVAMLQIANAKLGHRVAWKGGGFGMFATIDAPDFRTLRAFDEDGQHVSLPSHFSTLERRVRTFPDRASVRALAKAWRDDQAGAPIARVEVWKLRFSGNPMRSERVLLTEIELEDK